LLPASSPEVAKYWDAAINACEQIGVITHERSVGYLAMEFKKKKKMILGKSGKKSVEWQDAEQGLPR